MKKLQTERIDLGGKVRSMSYNIPGHGDRMRTNCERIDREFHKNIDRIKQINQFMYRAGALLREIPNDLSEEISTQKFRVIEDIKTMLKTSLKDLKATFI